MRLGIPQSLENRGKLRQLVDKLEFASNPLIDTHEEYEQLDFHSEDYYVSYSLLYLNISISSSMLISIFPRRLFSSNLSRDSFEDSSVGSIDI